MIETDQPGRYMAVFGFAPILFYKSIKYKDRFIGTFAVVLFLWDLYWIVNEEPKVSNGFPLLTYQ